MFVVCAFVVVLCVCSLLGCLSVVCCLVFECVLRVVCCGFVVRLCVVRALNSRYDPFLCQVNSLQHLLLLLQDEVLATRAAGVSLLGRLASLNPAPILPAMRKFLMEIIVELQCGVDAGRGREEATRLLVVFLRCDSLRRLIHPVLPVMIEALPLNGKTPRLAASAPSATAAAPPHRHVGFARRFLASPALIRSSFCRRPLFLCLTKFAR